MENDDIEDFAKKYLSNNSSAEPMEIDYPQFDNQEHSININQNNPEIIEEEKNEETLIKEIKEELKNQKRRQYSIKTKLNVIALVKRFNHTQNKITEIFHISKKSVRKFYKTSNEFKILEYHIKKYLLVISIFLKKCKFVNG